MKFLILSLTLLASIVHAETTTFTVKGMHCSACKETITKNVCDSKDVKASTDSCTVQLIDEDKQIGQIVMISKKGKKIDAGKVETNVKAAGPEYSVTNKEVK